MKDDILPEGIGAALSSPPAGREAVDADCLDGYMPPHCPDILGLFAVQHLSRYKYRNKLNLMGIFRNSSKNGPVNMISAIRPLKKQRKRGS